MCVCGRRSDGCPVKGSSTGFRNRKNPLNPPYSLLPSPKFLAKNVGSGRWHLAIEMLTKKQGNVGVVSSQRLAVHHHNKTRWLPSTTALLPREQLPSHSNGRWLFYYAEELCFALLSKLFFPLHSRSSTTAKHRISSDSVFKQLSNQSRNFSSPASLGLSSQTTK
jgi:hypothetical protein